MPRTKNRHISKNAATNAAGDSDAISPILLNALDSLRIGMGYFQLESEYSSRKHAILTIFHATELLLKERLHSIHPVLIYKNIDKTINDDSFTVGLADAIARLENTGLQLPKDQWAIVSKIQGRRNRIEHHRFDHDDEQDEIIIAEALKFIFYFTELVLNIRLEDHIDQPLLVAMRRRVMQYNELVGLADIRLDQWMKAQWPDWDQTVDNTPEAFAGTVDCPDCRQTSLVIGYHRKPFCFFCNVPIDAAECEGCGATYMIEDGPCCSAVA